MTRTKFIAFAVTPSILAVFALGAAYWGLGLNKTPEQLGKQLNQKAWDASFTERGMSVPPSGPRDGWHSERLFPKKPNTLLEWTEREQHVPGLLEVDQEGMQHWVSSLPPKAKILIVGASVAFGIYASSIDATYFSVVGRELEQSDLPVQIDVMAAGAWKSIQERTALMLHQYDTTFDLVVFVNGINDFCLAATPELSFFATSNSDYQTPSRVFADDYGKRLKLYMENMRAAADICRRHGIPMLAVLQPGIFENETPSDLEKRIIASTFNPSIGPATVVSTYLHYFDMIRNDLNSMESAGELLFFDGSQLFAQDKHTTFSDFWHFADPGHTLLGKALAAKINEILK